MVIDPEQTDNGLFDRLCGRINGDSVLHTLVKGNIICYSPLCGPLCARINIFISSNISSAVAG